MDWLFLGIAGLSEIVGVIGITKVNREKRISSYVFLIGGFVTSFLFLSLAMETIPMSTAYAIWTGVGTVGSALVGMFIYGESKEWKRLVFIAMVLSAAVGLKLIS